MTDASASTQPSASADIDVLTETLKKTKFTQETPKATKPVHYIPCLPNYIRELITEKRYWNRQYIKWGDPRSKKQRNMFARKVKAEIQNLVETSQMSETDFNTQTPEMQSLSALQIPEASESHSPSLNHPQTFATGLLEKPALETTSTVTPAATESILEIISDYITRHPDRFRKIFEDFYSDEEIL